MTEYLVRLPHGRFTIQSWSVYYVAISIVLIIKYSLVLVTIIGAQAIGDREATEINHYTPQHTP